MPDLPIHNDLRQLEPEEETNFERPVQTPVVIEPEPVSATPVEPEPIEPIQVEPVE